MPSCPDPKRAATDGVGLGDGGRRIDDNAAGREIGTGHVFQQRAAPGIGRVDQVERRVAKFRRIVRRDGGRHPHRDALRAVGEEIGEGARQHDRLVLRAVVGRTKIDRILLDAVEEEVRNIGQPRFGIAHGGWIIAVHIAEVSLSVDEGIALGEILSEAHERVVHRLVAVRMEFADHIAHDPRAFLEGGTGIEAQLLHRVQQSPVNRLEAVAGVGQGPPRDGGQRVL